MNLHPVMNILKKDKFIVGFAWGIFLPVLTFFLVYLLDDWIADTKKRPYILRDDQKFVLSVIFNVLIFRLYMINWKMEKSGRGILAATFMYAIFYLIFFQLMKKSFFISPVG